MIFLTRKEHFCASHRLFNPNWSQEQNYKVFGKCSHVHGHGHNYVLEVSVSGQIDKDTGLIFNLVTLKELIQKYVLDDVDHKHLNFDVPWLANKIPTTEVLVDCIWQQLEKQMSDHGAKLHRVTVWETDKNSATKTWDC